MRWQFIPASSQQPATSSGCATRNVFISKYFPLEHPATTATTSSRAERKLIINTFYCQESIIELQSAVNGSTSPWLHFHHQLLLLVFFLYILRMVLVLVLPPPLWLVLVAAARKIFAVIGPENAIAFRPTTQKAKIQMHSTTTSWKAKEKQKMAMKTKK